ncbi:hypothetical protein ANN_09939 [Periplaneta americana]|uniref:Transposase Tc1-like domain-containing protein n=1 Tax=Periplaneta americana TaxID=6978 RepID=A0ABQ8TRC7_PERAM|nr:hypothetical protein ANN_09939 [Periplaneta americana]
MEVLCEGGNEHRSYLKAISKQVVSSVRQAWRTGRQLRRYVTYRIHHSHLPSIPASLTWTDRLGTATCTHTLLSTDVHIRTDHISYTLRHLHFFSVVSRPHPSDSALNGILRGGPYSFIHSVESTLKYCNGRGPVCVNGSSPSFGAGLVARMPLDRLPLSRNHQRLRLQWARERHHWHAEWQNVVFSDESCFNLSYTDSRIRVRRYRGERNLRACTVERHSGQTSSVMIWGAIGYNMRSRLLRI